jgi:ketosteroid isomerase-like protein
LRACACEKAARVKAISSFERPIGSSVVNYRITPGSQLSAAALFVVLLTVGCASIPPTDLQADHPEERAQIERCLQEVIAAAEAKDFDRLDGYHLYGPKFTKFSGSSSERLDATAGRKGEHEGLAAITGLKMRVEALKIDVFGNVGIATFTLDFSFDSGGATVQRKERSTLVFVKERGAWKIVHEHLSATKP